MTNSADSIFSSLIACTLAPQERKQKLVCQCWKGGWTGGWRMFSLIPGGSVQPGTPFTRLLPQQNSKWEGTVLPSTAGHLLSHSAFVKLWCLSKDLELYVTWWEKKLIWTCLNNNRGLSQNFQKCFRTWRKKNLSFRLGQLIHPRGGLVLKLNFISSLFPHILPPSCLDCASFFALAVSDGIPQLPGGVGGPPRRLWGNVADANGGDCGFWDHFG